MNATTTDTLLGFLAERLKPLSSEMEDPDRRFSVRLPSGVPDSDVRHLILRHYESRGIEADIDASLNGRILMGGKPLVFSGLKRRDRLSIWVFPPKP